MDTVELVAGPSAFGRVKFAVIQPERSVWRVRIETEFEAGDSGEISAQRGRGQGAVALQRDLHEIFTFAFAYRNVLFDVFHRLCAPRV